MKTYDQWLEEFQFIAKATGLGPLGATTIEFGRMVWETATLEATNNKKDGE